MLNQGLRERADLGCGVTPTIGESARERPSNASRATRKSGHVGLPFSSLLLFQREGVDHIKCLMVGCPPCQASPGGAGTGEKGAFQPCPDPVDHLSARSG